MIRLRSTRISDEIPGRRIIRGELEPELLMALEFEWYQRGPLRPAKIRKLMRGIIEGSEFPDLLIGMRGHSYSELGNGSAMELLDPCFVIDGMQRVSAFLMVMEEHPDVAIRCGGKFFVDSTVEFENKLFKDVNTGQTSVAAAVILRNAKEHSRLAATLYGLTENQNDFALQHRVCWNQEADKSVGGQLIRGNLLLNILSTLHYHIIRGPGLIGNILAVLESVERRIDTIGLHQARLNLVTFFDALDEAWGICDRQIKFGVVIPLNSWTQIVARIFSNHREFWHNNELVVNREAIKDLRKINPNDKELVVLARGNKAQHDLLYRLMLDQMNKGKTAKNRYVDRDTLDKAEAAGERAAYYGSDHTHV